MTTMVFAGDSITDCGARREEPDRLGSGFVRIIAAMLGAEDPGLVVVNAGVSGSHLYHVGARWEADVVPQRPEVLTILVGVNDTKAGRPTPIDLFADLYRSLLDAVPSSVDRLVLAQPFALAVDERTAALRDALVPVGAVVARCAETSGARVLPLQQIFDDACRYAAASAWAPDGIHPSLPGHGLIARAWMRSCGVRP